MERPADRRGGEPPGGQHDHSRRRGDGSLGCGDRRNSLGDGQRRPGAAIVHAYVLTASAAAQSSATDPRGVLPYSAIAYDGRWYTPVGRGGFRTARKQAHVTIPGQPPTTITRAARRAPGLAVCIPLVILALTLMLPA